MSVPAAGHLGLVDTGQHPRIEKICARQLSARGPEMKQTLKTEVRALELDRSGEDPQVVQVLGCHFAILLKL